LRHHDLKSNRMTTIGSQPLAIGVRFSGDATTCIAASSDGDILEWDIAAQRQARRWRHGDRIDSFAVAQNVCVSAGADKLRLWRLSDLKLILDASLDSGKRPLVCLSSDALRLAVLEGDVLSYWTLSDGTPEFVARTTLADRVIAAQFSNLGDHLAVACADGSVWLRDAQGKVREISSRAAIPALLVFHPDSSRLLIARDGGVVEIRNCQPSPAETLVLPHDTCVAWASFSISGLEVVTSENSGTVSLWDAVSGELILRRSNDSGQLCPAFLCDRDSQLAVCLNSGVVTCDHIQGISNPLEEIVWWSELISGQRFGALPGSTPLTTSETEQRWKARRPIRRMSRPEL
jgi:WD40 repeat protein